eukprot:COSAG01_NODE_31353_length_599_cov_0.820000_1_plen_82_part_10
MDSILDNLSLDEKVKINKIRELQNDLDEWEDRIIEDPDSPAVTRKNKELRRTISQSTPSVPFMAGNKVDPSQERTVQRELF